MGDACGRREALLVSSVHLLPLASFPLPQGKPGVRRSGDACVAVGQKKRAFAENERRSGAGRGVFVSGGDSSVCGGKAGLRTEMACSSAEATAVAVGHGASPSSFSTLKRSRLSSSPSPLLFLFNGRHVPRWRFLHVLVFLLFLCFCCVVFSPPCLLVEPPF